MLSILPAAPAGHCLRAPRLSRGPTRQPSGIKLNNFLPGMAAVLPAPDARPAMVNLLDRIRPPWSNMRDAIARAFVRDASRGARYWRADSLAGVLITALECVRLLSGGDAFGGVAQTLPASAYLRPGTAWASSLRAGADVGHPAGDMAMPATYELHVQEGFAGETIEILVDGTVTARFEARTRMQIGLAHIERLELAPGATVTVRIAGKPTSSSITAEKNKNFININLKDNKIILDATESSPGYL